MTEVLWTSAEIAVATGGVAQGEWRARGVSIDSRQIAEGDLFVALVGDTHDGHDFVDAALAAGAAGVLVEASRATRWPEHPLVGVADTTAALTALGRAARDRTDARVLSVTGSVGKTGTKEMLALTLGRQGSTHASRGNLNNHYGAPLSLARMPRASRFAVFELGMNHAGEIAPLSRLVRPHATIITAVEAVHLENFADETGIADAKAEIFLGQDASGRAILNRDNRHFDRLVRRAREAGLSDIVTFGADPTADFRLISCEGDGAGSAVEISARGRRLGYRIGAPGRHWALNSLAVLAGVEAVGGDVAAASQALADIRPPQGRGAQELIRLAGEGGVFTLIDESYNASPPAVRAAIAVLGATAPGPGGRRVLVLGDMLELGPEAAAIHAALAPDIVAAGLDLVHACGPLSAALIAALPAGLRGAHAPDSSALAPLVAASVHPGDLVCVKGSLGSRMKQVVEALRARAAPSGGR